jgi:hypothetical protein
MDDDRRDVRVVTGAVDHSMKFMTPRLVSVSTGRLLELSYNLDLVRFRITADLTELFGHREAALLLLPGGDTCPSEGITRSFVWDQSGDSGPINQAM